MKYLLLSITLFLLPPVSALAKPLSGTVEVIERNDSNDTDAIKLWMSPSTSPEVTISTTEISNRGDYSLEFDLGAGVNPVHTGALISSTAQHARLVTVDNIFGNPLFIPVYATSGAASFLSGREFYYLTASELLSNSEFNINVAFGFFPYSEFLGGNARGVSNGDELTVFYGSDNLELDEEITENSEGSVKIDLRAFGATSSQGILLASSSENDDNYAIVQPREDDTFDILTVDNNADFFSPSRRERSGFSFTYLPTSAAGTGHIAALGRVVDSANTEVQGGNFSLTKGPEGQWYLAIPGQNADTGTLLVTSINSRTAVSYEWDPQQGSWVIESRALPEATLQRPTLPAVRAFNFAFITKEPFEELPITPLPEAPIHQELMAHGDSFIGSGIDTATGAFTLGHQLLAVEAVRSIDFSIGHNSRLTGSAGPLGTSWSHSYEARIEGTTGEDLTIHWDAHRHSRFLYVPPISTGVGSYIGEGEDVQFASLRAQIPHPNLPPGVWRLRLFDGTTYYFGSGGRLSYIENVIGQGIALSYDDAGRLSKLEEPFSEAALFLTYNDRSLVETITDDLGRTVTLTYDASSRLTNVLSPSLGEEAASRSANYSYDTAGRITSASDFIGESTFTAAYDLLGRIIRQGDGRPETPDATITYTDLTGPERLRTIYTDRLGHAWTFEHDPGFHLLSTTTPLGNTSSYTYDIFGQRRTLTDPLGATSTFDYNDRGDVSSFTDAAGHITRFTSDFKHQVEGITDALGRESYIGRDTSGRLNSVKDALGNTDRKEYHDNGQVSQVKLADGAEVNFGLTEKGRTGSISNPSMTGVNQNLDYDLAGRLIRTTNYGGEVTNITYTPTSETRTTTDAEGNVTANEYDHRGRLIQVTDPRGFVSTSSYDGNGNVLTRSNALGETTTYTYDHEDRILTATDARGSTTSLAYDAEGRNTSTTDAIDRTTRLVYDGNGNILETYAPGNRRVLKTTYDTRGYPVQLEDELGHILTAIYDAVGRKTSTTDALGRTSTFAYDELDRLISVTDPAGRTATQTYESDDVIASYTGPGAAQVNYSYSRSNNLTEITSSADTNRRERFGYNARDLLARTETATGGEDIRYGYDNNGRITFSEPSNEFAGPRHSYSYDDSGNLLTSGNEENSASTTRTYDDLGRLASFSNGRGNTLTYGYDTAGNLSTLTYPGGKILTHTYDPVNRLASTIDWNGRITNYTWDTRDRLTKLELPNDTVRNLRYDASGNILYREDLDSSGQIIVSYTYHYDAAGRLQAEQAAPPTTPAAITPRTYSYDGQDNRLTSIDGKAVNMDRDGNIDSVSDVNNTLLSALGQLQYSVRGKLERSSSQLYAYDGEDRLINWAPRSDANSRTHFFTDPTGRGKIIAKEDSSGTSLYIHGTGLLYEETSTGGIRVFHYDHRGSTVALSDATGSVRGRVSYTPYGEIAARTGDTSTPFLFNGLFGVLTSPDGLNYMRFRWYSPQLRRFLTKDAHLGNIGSASTLNRFTYAGANPVMNIDPDGEAFWIVAGAAVGAVVNVGITLTIDYLEDGNIDSSFGDIASAAIGGAVGGAIIAATGGLGAGAVFAGSVAAGGASVLSEELSLVAFGEKEFDAKEIAKSTGIGLVTGAVGGGYAGRKSARVATKLARRKSVRGLTQLIGRSAKNEFSDGAKRIFGSVLGNFAVKNAPQYFALFSPPSGGGGGSSGGDLEIIVGATTEINAGRLNKYGEFIHYERYLEAISASGLPVPSHPSNTLTGF